MKKLIFVLASSFFCFQHIYSQELDTIPISSNKLTLGFFQDGGSLIGFDFEQLVTENIGLSVVAGFLGFGASIHYHLKPAVNSSSIAFNYLHQGIGDTYFQSAIGPSYVIKISKLFSGQLGMAEIIDKGPNFYEFYEEGKEPEIMLIYSLGVYF
jgi:hypothetical protein